MQDLLMDLMSLAERQGGFVTRQQARDAGVSAKVQRNRLARGEWTVHLGCLRICQSTYSPDWQDAWALGLRLGPGTIVTGPTAFRIAGKQTTSTQLIAVVPHGRNVKLGGVSVLHDDSPRLSVAASGFRVARPLDALADMLINSTDEQARAYLDESLQLHQIEPAQLMSIIEKRKNRNGVKRLRRLSRIAYEGTHSDGERALNRILKSAGLAGWIPNFPLLDNGNIIAELDFARPDLKLCLEVDGRAYHSDAVSFRRDRERQNQLVLKGWLVLRFTWEQITKEPAAVVAAIRKAIRLRAA